MYHCSQPPTRLSQCIPFRTDHLNQPWHCRYELYMCRVLLFISVHSTAAVVDYNSEATSVRFGACERTQCVNLTIIDDEELEDTEIFTIGLEKPLISTNSFVLSPRIKVVNITDNDLGTYCANNGGVCFLSMPYVLMFSYSGYCWV